jgi:hypothetical protein
MPNQNVLICWVQEFQDSETNTIYLKGGECVEKLKK